MAEKTWKLKQSLLQVAGSNLEYGSNSDNRRNS